MITTKGRPEVLKKKSFFLAKKPLILYRATLACCRRERWEENGKLKGERERERREGNVIGYGDMLVI